MPERLKNLFRGPAAESVNGPSKGLFASPAEKETVLLRQSRGLEQFFTYIRGQSGLTILDLSGANQANVSFITNLGHKLYSEDFLRGLREAFGEDVHEQTNPGQIEYFLRQNLNYPDGHFDGVLVWDTLEYMGPALLSATIERLSRVVRLQSYMLAFFHADDKTQTVPCYSFRIQDFNKLQVSQRGTRRPAQLFNNRSLERLFQNFESVKFFLTREHLREVIIRR